MPVPAAGWYIDPESDAQLRWWSGEEWTEHKQPNPQYLQAPIAATSVVNEPYVPMASYNPAASGSPRLSRVEKDRQIRRNNSFAYIGCVFSLLAFLFNPVAILSLLGIVFSAIGLSKSHELDGHQKVTGRGTAIAGIVLGLIGLALFAWLLSRALD
jgi:hypothetical protein